MEITVNGQKKSVDKSLTISELLTDLNIEATKIAVEHNRQIIAKSTYDKTQISGGDKLEIVAFIGGG